MDEPLRIGLRVLFTYLVLHQLLRHAGHRIVASGVGSGGEGHGIDLILALIVGDLIDDLFWAEVSAAQFVTAAGTLAVLHVSIGLLRRAGTTWWKVIEGTPAILLTDGIPDHRAMRAHRVNESELAKLLRREGIDRSRWPAVRAAYLENSGQLSVLLAARAKPATRADRAPIRKVAR